MWFSLVKLWKTMSLVSQIWAHFIWSCRNKDLFWKLKFTTKTSASDEKLWSGTSQMQTWIFLHLMEIITVQNFSFFYSIELGWVSSRWNQSQCEMWSLSICTWSCQYFLPFVAFLNLLCNLKLLSVQHKMGLLLLDLPMRVQVIAI